MKKNILILFPCEWIAYSPTILNLVSLLSEKAEVKVIAFDNKKYNNSQLDKTKFELIRSGRITTKILTALGLYKAYKYYLLKKAAQHFEPDAVIGVDSIGIYTALQLFKKAHFLSLEIERDWFLKHSDTSRMESTAIQSPERLNYLFHNDKPLNIYFLPNSPIQKTPSDHLPRSLDGNTRLIFIGNAIPSHGVEVCCKLMSTLDGATLTIKGIISAPVRENLERRYRNLINSGRIILDDSYLAQDEIVEYLRKFDIGFCFYDFTLISKKNFNYLSSPSGKMYSYLAAGVPIIGSNIVGLQLVRTYNAGVLLDNADTQSISKAVATIQDRIVELRKNCLNAAKDQEFSLHAAPYLADLLNLRQ